MRNGLYALNGGGIWNPMLNWEDRRSLRKSLVSGGYSAFFTPFHVPGDGQNTQGGFTHCSAPLVCSVKPLSPVTI
ncbi:hypothetical protein MUK42_17095 [Musa troglodytarum]|uniref:Uncharacterized protein n=1 Tax=Musa troglodytarum TaxID=320322 RepID=A0A9E7H5H9_9LILI|nr:hypothetical protein MUK42_17095 [Musa troglodytarum]